MYSPAFIAIRLSYQDDTRRLILSVHCNIGPEMWVLCMLKILGLVAAVCGNFCPSACRCGIYNNLNTVDCSFKMLVTVESEMPKRTQVLDLSHNNIMEISDREFCVR